MNATQAHKTITIWVETMMSEVELTVPIGTDLDNMFCGQDTETGQRVRIREPWNCDITVN